MNNKGMHKKGEQKTKDQTPKVTGIGGIFFFSDNPDVTKLWDGKNLGLRLASTGQVSNSGTPTGLQEINYLQWNPSKAGSKYFAPSKKEFMINYRIQDLEGLVEKLRANGVTIVDEIESFDYGKFIHIK